jgi:hypothetical protein
MIGQIISHYKILEKLGEVPIRLNLAFLTYTEKLSSFVELSFPPSLGGSGRSLL